MILLILKKKLLKNLFNKKKFKKVKKWKSKTTVLMMIAVKKLLKNQFNKKKFNKKKNLLTMMIVKKKK